MDFYQMKSFVDGGEYLVKADSLPQGYHEALNMLWFHGQEVACPDYNTNQKEISVTIEIEHPFQEPMISKLFIGGPQDLQQYVMEMVSGILDFEVYQGKWDYTYHNRMVQYPIDNQTRFPNEWYKDQITFIIDELKRNPDSRRAVIDIRDNSEDMYSNDPACLQHIQFFIRNNKLNMKVLFRSNDACKATFMNMFALIMLQKSIADSLGVEVGTYTHRANSFHVYEKDYGMLNGYIKRINLDSIDDLCYDYVGDWEQEMKDSVPSILDKVRKLKEGS